MAQTTEERRATRLAAVRRWRRLNPQGATKWRRANPEKIRAARLRHKYNLTLEEWTIMFDVQGGACAICGRSAAEFKRGLSVDHDHSTHLVRGLLCWNCNDLLPCRKNLIAELQRAIVYLTSPPAVLALGYEKFANPVKRKKRKKP